MQSTMYVKLAEGKTAEDLRQHLEKTYATEPFVKVGCRAGGCSWGCA
jgi:N-acetyl-gamma-glutamylphosphate reductase